MIDVSVLIVTWNNEDEIRDCVSSVISNSGDLIVELIIIDNNSSDDTFSIVNKLDHSRLQSFQNNTNTGYTKAINQAIRYSAGKNIFLLNPDTIIKENCIKILNDFLDKNESYGACAPLMMPPLSTSSPAPPAMVCAPEPMPVMVSLPEEPSARRLPKRSTRAGP